MKKSIYIVFIFSQFCWAQVGINTTNPQQALHIAGTGTIRVESLNAANNNFNGGDIDNDGDLTNNTFPLYVNENGDFTLELKTHTNTEDTDALDDTSLPTTTVYMLSTDISGTEKTTIKTYSLTVSRASLVEIKYNLSFEVYLDNTYAIIVDNKARRISTWLSVSGQTRAYGPVSKCYSSGSINSVAGTMYGSSTAYITLPSAGTYDISLMGGVSSGLRLGGGLGGPSLSTYVEFATGNDFMLIRIH